MNRKLSKLDRTLAVSSQDEIPARLERDGSIGVEGMADRFGVSRETIPRDLKALAEGGRLAMMHGGATRCSDEPVLAIKGTRQPGGKGGDRMGRGAPSPGSGTRLG